MAEARRVIIEGEDGIFLKDAARRRTTSLIDYHFNEASISPPSTKPYYSFDTLKSNINIDKFLANFIPRIAKNRSISIWN